ncbi:hypothetical protein VTN96DRAFT_3243 [Rasamsonia emersonii]
MVKQIPGFYYDPEKKKYFRIQANHLAPAGSQYSRDAVKKREHQKKQHERRITFGRRTAKERVKRAGCLTHPLTRVGTEVGEQLMPGFAMQARQGKAYASQLQRRELCKFSRDGSELPIADFARHDRSGVIVAGINQGNTSQVTICPPYSGDADKWSYQPAREAVISVEQYRMSSISLSHTGYFLMTMDSGPKGDSCLVTRFLPDPEVYGAYPWSYNQVVAASNRVRDKGTLWCSAARPTGEKPYWAIGTSDGLHVMEGQQGHWVLGKRRMPGGRAWDITAVEWLTSDVIVSGLRNSAILLYDIRSNGWSERLQHAHSVAKVRKVDEYRLVVAGYKSLEMYDLRYPKNGMQTKPRPNAKGHTSTKPYLSFPDYDSELMHQIDISQELGLLASCTDYHKIQLYSLADGSLVPSPVSSYQHFHPISRICFENGDYPVRDGQASRLLVSSGAVIEEWTW